VARGLHWQQRMAPKRGLVEREQAAAARDVLALVLVAVLLTVLVMSVAFLR
jgi:hypothetical protein